MTDVQPVGVSRERSYAWGDPHPGASAAATMDGITFLTAMLRGEVAAPGIAATLGFELESVEVGSAVFVMRPEEFHYNPLASMHGGVYATLLDSAAGCAVHSTLPVGAWFTSLDLNVKFLRRVTAETGPVRCEGRVVHAGSRTALARAELTDSSGKLLAEASSSCLIVRS